jgi:hypothetical protein
MPADPPPFFIRTPGDIVGLPPYRATGCLMHGFFLKGSKAAQQRLCDVVLNRPAAGEQVFHAVCDEVLVTGVYVDKMGSSNPIDATKGVIREWDLGFWTAVHGGKVGARDDWQTYWLPSFLFVDTPSAMASGREVFGYPKTVADFRGHDPANPGDPSVALWVQHYPAYSPAQTPVTEPLVTVTSGAPDARTPGLAESFMAAWDVIGGLARHNLRHLPPWPGICMPQILLRQVRDPVNIGRASLQSILSVTPRSRNLKPGGFLHSGTQVALAPSASHPIAETLGLATTQPAMLGLWITQDFDVGAAKTLWSHAAG